MKRLGSLLLCLSLVFGVFLFNPAAGGAAGSVPSGTVLGYSISYNQGSWPEADHLYYGDMGTFEDMLLGGLNIVINELSLSQSSIVYFNSSEQVYKDGAWKNCYFVFYELFNKDKSKCIFMSIYPDGRIEAKWDGTDKIFTAAETAKYFTITRLDLSSGAVPATAAQSVTVTPDDAAATVTVSPSAQATASSTASATATSQVTVSVATSTKTAPPVIEDAMERMIRAQGVDDIIPATIDTSVSSLRLRSKAESGSDVITVIPKNETVYLATDTVENRWVKTYWMKNGKLIVGYVYHAYLALG